MGRLLIAFIVLGLLLVGLGGLRASEGMAVTGQLSATEQEADEGYFALGPDTMVVAKPGSGLHHWLRSHLGQRVTINLAKEASN